MIGQRILSPVGRQMAAGLWAFSMIVLPPVSATASSFQVNPVRIVLAPTKTISSLTIRNNDQQPVSVRVLTYHWTQENGQDVYSPTDDVTASPPIFTITPGGKQLLRLGVRRRTAGIAYRVILEEIPRPSRANYIQVALRLNLPMYVLGEADSKASIVWTAWRDTSGEIVLEARNSGGTHAQVTGIGLVAPGGALTSLTSSMGVILPASIRQWKVGRHPELQAGADLHLSIRSARGEDRIVARLEAR